ncbi:hypothetical protein LCGC14_2628690, partial [marine sediment metagenome]
MGVEKGAKHVTPLPEWGGMEAPTVGRAITEQSEGLYQFRDDVADVIRTQFDSIENIDARAAKAIEAQLKDAEKVVTGMVSEARGISGRITQLTRNFAIHDYGRKRNFDLGLGLVYPYSFWYTRTYASWMQRLVSKAGTIKAYSTFRELLAKEIEDAPDWDKYSLKINSIPGIDLENPIFVMFENMVNPLNAITGVPFQDNDKRGTSFAKFADDLGTMGPSIYTPYALAYGLSVYLKGAEEMGRKWMSRLIPQTKFARAVTSKVLSRGKGPTEQHPGIELDPVLVTESLYEGRGPLDGLGPYERGRIARGLGAF